MENRQHNQPTPTSPAAQRQKPLALPPGAKPRVPAPAPVGTARQPPPVSNSYAFCVWGVGRRAPRMRHPTKERAIAEATRLAGLNPGVEYLVYELRSVAKRVVKS